VNEKARSDKKKHSFSERNEGKQVVAMIDSAVSSEEQGRRRSGMNERRPRECCYCRIYWDLVKTSHVLIYLVCKLSSDRLNI